VWQGAMMLTFLRFGQNTDQMFSCNQRLKTFSAVFKSVTGITIWKSSGTPNVPILISTSDHIKMDKAAADATRTK
jgi:hypothetical protein